MASFFFVGLVIQTLRVFLSFLVRAFVRGSITVFFFRGLVPPSNNLGNGGGWYGVVVEGVFF